MSYAPPPKPRPHGAMYLVPLFVFILFSVGACIGGGVKFFTSLTDKVDDLERVSVSEGGSVHLEKRDYTVYYEESDGDADVSVPSMTYRILDPNDVEVLVKGRSSNLEYSTGSRSGIAIGSFEANQAGTYRVEVTDAPGISTGGSLAIGDDVHEGTGTSVLIFVGVGSVGFILALVIWIVIARKRGNSKRQIQQTYGGGGYPPTGGGYPSPGGGYPPPGGGYGPPGSQQPGGYGAPGSYPPAGGYGSPGSYPPAGDGPPQPGGYPPPPGGFPPR